MMRSMSVPDMSCSLSDSASSCWPSSLHSAPRIMLATARRPLLSKVSVGLARRRDHAVGLGLSQGQLVLHPLSFPLQAHPAQFTDQLDEFVGRSLLGDSGRRLVLVVRHWTLSLILFVKHRTHSQCAAFALLDTKFIDVRIKHELFTGNQRNARESAV